MALKASLAKVLRAWTCYAATENRCAVAAPRCAPRRAAASSRCASRCVASASGFPDAQVVYAFRFRSAGGEELGVATSETRAALCGNPSRLIANNVGISSREESVECVRCAVSSSSKDGR